jgi:hypothetical protein
MRSLILATALLFMVLLSSQQAQAATYIINPDGSGDFATIQQALYAADEGDVVQLADGVFTGPGNRDLDTNETMMTIESQSGDPTLCTIDCEGSSGNPHFGIEYSALDAETILRGITIANGYGAEFGGALRLFEGSITVENCIFADNSALNFGGAVYAVEWSEATFFNCEFRNNSADQYGLGGAVFAQQASSLTFDGCTFVENQANYGGTLYADGSGQMAFTLCLFAENMASYGGVVSARGNTDVRLYNSTLFRNSANYASAVYLQQSALCRVNSTIIAYGRGGAAFSDDGSASYIIGCSDIYSNEGGDWVGSLSGQGTINNNANVDPQFCDPMGNPANFSLMPESPAGDSHPCGLLGARATDASWPAPVYVLFADGSGMQPTIQAGVDAAPLEAVLALEDGTYTGTGNRDIELRGKTLSVKGRNSDPTTVVIDAQGGTGNHHRAFWVHEGEAPATTLEFLTLRNGYFLVDLDLQDEGYGGAIRVTDGANLRVRSCRFEGNTVTHPMPFGYPDAGQGGAIFQASNGSLLVEDCIFTGNTASNTFLANSGSIQIINSTFSDERMGVVCNADGGLFVSGCIFNSFSGPGLSVSDVVGSVHVQLCEFSSVNRFFYSANFLNCGSLLIDQCLFNEELSDDYVALPLLWIEDSQVTIQETIFAGNGIEARGGVRLKNSNTLLTNCDFTDITGEYSDGALKIENGICELQGCNFVGNSFADGGAVNALETEVSFAQCSFSGNHAESLGGGANFQASTVTINGTDFLNNIAADGGGFYADSCNLIVENCNFDANSDGLRHHGSSLGGVTVTGTTFTNHTAGWAAEVDSMFIRDVVFDDCAFQSGSRGLRLFDVGGFRVANTEFSDNLLQQTLVLDHALGYVDTCTFDRNSSQYEGGALHMLVSDVIVQDCSFADNSSELTGGAAYQDQGFATFARCSFDRNTTAGNGGGFAGYYGTTVLNNCDFDANISGDRGGSVYTSNLVINLNSCSLTGSSSAGSGGGAAHYYGGNVTYAGGLVEGNHSVFGGGIYSLFGNIAFNDLEITNNTAGYGGGTASVNGEIVFTDCQVTNNSASKNGGLGVSQYVGESFYTQMNGTLIAGNTSTFGGSAIGIANGSLVNFQRCTIVGNDGSGSEGQIYSEASSEVVLGATIVSFSVAGPAVTSDESANTYNVLGCDIFGNAGGDWINEISGWQGVECNFSLDPLFCAAGEGDFNLAESSPCIAENNACELDVGMGSLGCSGVSSAPETDLPENFALLGNFPNPFNPSTDISFELPTTGPVILEIFDITGRRVRRLIKGENFVAGSHQVTWDGKNDHGQIQSSGIYLYKVQATGQALRGKMAMIR